MELALPLLAKLGLVVLGVGALERSFHAYRARRRDRTRPPDRVSDFAWRLLGAGLALFLISGLSIQLVPGFPRSLIMPFFVLMCAGIVMAFAAALLIGARSGS